MTEDGQAAGFVHQKAVHMIWTVYQEATAKCQLPTRLHAAFGVTTTKCLRLNRPAFFLRYFMAL